MRNSARILPLLAVLFCACSKVNSDAQTSPASPPPALANPAPTNGAASMNEKGYVLGTNGNLGTLYLSFPAGWQDAVKHVKEKDRTFDAVFFAPSKESDYNFSVEIVMAGETNGTNQGQIKAAFLRQAQNELTNVVETAIELTDFKGVQAAGSYFRVTDKKWAVISPPEGEAKYLTQGYASLGPLVLTFRLLSNQPRTEEPAALEVIKTAHYTTFGPPGVPRK